MAILPAPHATPRIYHPIWTLRRAAVAVVVGITLGLVQARAAETPELVDTARAVAPITHQPYFRGERELFGYAPRYAPGAVSFDLNNRPYIRDGASVMTLESSGAWARYNFDTYITNYFTARGWQPTFTIDSGTHPDTRVVFDWSGDAYTVLRVKRGWDVLAFLLYSRDRCRSWQVYALPPGEARIEFQDGHNRLDRPPSILLFSKNRLELILPKEEGNGTLSIPRAVLVASDSLLALNHSGAGNSAISVGNAVYVVYPSAVLVSGKKGTPQYVVRYDRATGKLGSRTLLGTGLGTTTDNHDIPAISVDSTGVLHVVLGAHHQELQYTRTTAAAAASNQWTKAVSLGASAGVTSPRFTYVGLLCDAANTLYVTTRWTDKSYKFNLALFAKPANTSRWRHQMLVAPFRTMYSSWYQHLNLDRTNRLFLDYQYYGNQYNAQELAAYKLKWPLEKLVAPVGNWIENVQAHDPVILVSQDGMVWRIATTPDFK